MIAQKTAHELGVAGCAHILLDTIDNHLPLRQSSEYPYERILYFVLAHIDTRTRDATTTTQHLFGTYKHWAEADGYPYEDSITFTLFRDHVDLILTALQYARVPADPAHPDTAAAFVGPAFHPRPNRHIPVYVMADNILAMKENFFPALIAFRDRAGNPTSALTAPVRGLPPTRYPTAPQAVPPKGQCGSGCVATPTPDSSTKNDEPSLWDLDYTPTHRCMHTPSFD